MFLTQGTGEKFHLLLLNDWLVYDHLSLTHFCVPKTNTLGLFMSDVCAGEQITAGTLFSDNNLKKMHDFAVVHGNTSDRRSVTHLLKCGAKTCHLLIK